MLQWGLALAALGLAMVVFAPNYPVVLIGITLCGLGVAAYHPEASKIAHFAGATRKATAMSTFALSGNIGLALGPGLMTLGVSIGGMRGALIFVPVAALSLLWVQLRRDRLYELLPKGTRKATTAPGPAGRPRSLSRSIKEFRIRDMQRHHRWMAILLVYIFLRSSAHTGMQTLIPLYFQAHMGAGELLSGALLTAFLIGGAVGTILGGLAADLFGSRKIAILSFVTAPLLIAAVPFAGQGLLGLGLMFFAGVTLIASFSLTTVMGQKFLPSRVGLDIRAHPGLFRRDRRGGGSRTRTDRRLLGFGKRVLGHRRTLGGRSALCLPLAHGSSSRDLFRKSTRSVAG